MLTGRWKLIIGMIFATALVLPIAIGDGLLTHFKPEMLLTCLALALFSSAIPFTLEMQVLGKIPAKTFSILMSLEPAVAAISGLSFCMNTCQITNGWPSP